MQYVQCTVHKQFRNIFLISRQGWMEGLELDKNRIVKMGNCNDICLSRSWEISSYFWYMTPSSYPMQGSLGGTVMKKQYHSASFHLLSFIVLSSTYRIQLFDYNKIAIINVTVHKFFWLATKRQVSAINLLRFKSGFVHIFLSLQNNVSGFNEVENPVQIFSGFHYLNSNPSFWACFFDHLS